MASDGANGPLDGLVILDLTQFIAGPFGSQYLADLGADVIKIEQPDGGDLGRGAGVDFLEGESLHFLAVNRNKRSVVLDLKSDAGRAVFYRLVKVADAVIDNFRPGVTDRLGIDHARLAEINPSIVCTSISAFGHSGPRRQQPGYDLAMQAMSGVMSLTGEEGGEPVRSGVPIGDLVGGMAGALGTVAALLERSRTGHGQHVDVALFDTQLSLLMYWAAIYLQTGRVPGPVGAGNPEIVPYGTFHTEDSRIVIAVFGDSFFQRLCDALDLRELAQLPELATNAGRVRHRSRVVGTIEAVLRRKPTAYWLSLLERDGIPCAPVNDVEEALADPQVAARDMVIEARHPTVGQLRLVGNPVKTAVSRAVTVPPPLLGEHTREVLTSLIGLDDQELDALEHSGVTSIRSTRRSNQGEADSDDR